MFGVSLAEGVVIFVIALLVFGPEKLPELAKLLGKISGEVQKNVRSLRREFYNAMHPPEENPPPRLHPADLATKIQDNVPPCPEEERRKLQETHDGNG
jgi:sec-independent protein translocase protein TatB